MIRALGLALVLIGAFSISAKAQSAFIMTLEQDGSNVVATGSGDFDVENFDGPYDGHPTAFIEAQSGYIVSGDTTASGDVYETSGQITGPNNFGDGDSFSASSGSGDVVAIEGDDALVVPSGYTSGDSLSTSATWDDTTLSGLGVTPGTYTWTWGNDGENSFTLYAGVTPVPEPSDYGWGVLLATLGFVAWRRFRPAF
jgi:hypothetical protein